jgi:hypothetical protein
VKIATRTTFIIAAALLIAACTPRYVLAPGERGARLQSVDDLPVSLCRDGEKYFVAPSEGDTVAAIPAGVPISLGRVMVFQVYGGSYNCHPKFTFVPEPGELYVFDAEMIGNKCAAEVARVAPSARTGLGTVRPLDGGKCARD